MDIKDKIESKLRVIFPDSIQRDSAAQILADYNKKHQNITATSGRVNLAILKLASEQPGLLQLENLTNEALIDYKNILNRAELPRASRSWDLSDCESKKRVKEDLEEYRLWFNT